MKKLLLLPLLLLSFMVKAQLPVLRGPDGVTVEDTRLYILKNFRVPVFSDTTSANVSKGLDSVGTMFFKRGTRFVFVRTADANGTHKWDTLGGVSGGGASGDTVYLYQIGTAAGQIETLYAVDGNLRKSRWVPGYGTLPFLAADSAAYIDIDTTSIAYKSWVIQQFGTSVNNLQQVIDNGHTLSREDTISGNWLHSLVFDSLTFVDVVGGTFRYLSRLGNGSFTADSTLIQAELLNGGATVFDKFRLSTDSIVISSWDLGSNIKSLSFTPTTARLAGLGQANDTTTYKPVGIDNTGILKRMDGWAGGGGGGGTTNGIGRDTVQAYTSGTTLTQSASTNYIQVNPASVQATLTITTLASGGTWHTSNDLYIVFGGTVTSGPVITTLAITAGAGLTLIQSVTPSGTYSAGEVIHYHKVGSFLYRIN